MVGSLLPSVTNSFNLLSHSLASFSLNHSFYLLIMVCSDRLIYNNSFRKGLAYIDMGNIMFSQSQKRFSAVKYTIRHIPCLGKRSISVNLHTEAISDVQAVIHKRLN